MVSHQPTGSNVSNIRPSRGTGASGGNGGGVGGVGGGGEGGDIRGMDSVYQSHPLPSMPRHPPQPHHTSHHHRLQQPHHHHPHHHHHQPRPLGDSMLAYTERMREISKFRQDSAVLGDAQDTVLEVQARHIPKHAVGGGGVPQARNPHHHPPSNPPPRHPKKPRRPMSLDELTGRPGGGGGGGGGISTGGKGYSNNSNNNNNNNNNISSTSTNHSGGGGASDKDHHHKPHRRPLSEPTVIPSLGLPSSTSKKHNGVGGVGGGGGGRERGGGAGGDRDGDGDAEAAAAAIEAAERRIRISFVSAADLFDLVDFSLRSKRSRHENIRLARAQDTLRLINEAQFFRSIHTRLKNKAGQDRDNDDEDDDNNDNDDDRASLIVHGTSSSPRDLPRANISNNHHHHHRHHGNDNPANTAEGGWVSGGGAKHGEWARKEAAISVGANSHSHSNSNSNSHSNSHSHSHSHSNSRRSSKHSPHRDPYDSDDEEDEESPGDDEDDEDEDDDVDLLHERRLLLMHPPKLRFRPKRAKRMRLHRSRLSIIPEDEKHRQEAAALSSAAAAAHAQNTSSSFSAAAAATTTTTQDPVIMPTRSSLAAIKGSRKYDGRATGLVYDSDPVHPPVNAVTRHNADTYQDHDSSKNKHHRKAEMAITKENGAHIWEQSSTKRHTPRGEDNSSQSRKHADSSSPRRATDGHRMMSALTGQHVTLETAPNTRTKAQKKFKKLIFLRDQPDQAYQKYS